MIYSKHCKLCCLLSDFNQKTQHSPEAPNAMASSKSIWPWTNLNSSGKKWNLAPLILKNLRAFFYIVIHLWLGFSSKNPAVSTCLMRAHWCLALSNCVLQFCRSAEFFSPEMFIIPKTQKLFNTNTWSHEIATIVLKFLENTEPQKRHSQKMMHSTKILSRNMPFIQASWKPSQMSRKEQQKNHKDRDLF